MQHQPTKAVAHDDDGDNNKKNDRMTTTTTTIPSSSEQDDDDIMTNIGKAAVATNVRQDLLCN